MRANNKDYLTLSSDDGELDYINLQSIVFIRIFKNTQSALIYFVNGNFSPYRLEIGDNRYELERYLKTTFST